MCSWGISAQDHSPGTLEFLSFLSLLYTEKVIFLPCSPDIVANLLLTLTIKKICCNLKGVQKTPASTLLLFIKLHSCTVETFEMLWTSVCNNMSNTASIEKFHHQRQEVFCMIPISTCAVNEVLHKLRSL